MTTHYATTEDERELLDSARRVLGGNLSEFLLCGLGEPHLPRRRYTSTSIRKHGPGLVYQLEVVGESEKGLPGGRDPVVMAALLHLLWTVGRGRDEVVFRDEDLLEIIAWPDTREARLAVEAAVERYYNTAYHRTSREPLGAGKGERLSSQVQKLVTGYDTTMELREGPPKEVRKSTILYFTTKLIEEVTGAEKYFLGIDFERLEPLRRINSEDHVAHFPDN
jgi:hypothetical protein